VVIASGIVFLSLGGRQGASTRLTEPKILAGLEAGAFFILVLTGLGGTVLAQGFFSNFTSDMGLPDVAFIVFLNTVIGLKVGAGIGFMSIAMLGRVHD
jgi:multicomponent Na+:H+ antiporter subunit B